ncbi:MAG: L-serine ammonia-lyase [Myxococcales bacterium]|nr:L-serine ammonia-lyase [Myxococcales bacterium]
MTISVFDLFSIGIGPSSSHTVGPMRAALTFASGLRDDGLLEKTATIRVELFGSLGATGKGHGSDKAILLGLEGETPEETDTDLVDARLARIREQGKINVLGEHEIDFVERDHLTMHRRKSLPHHSNAMRFAACDASGEELRSKLYYSVGGGFVVNEDAIGVDRIQEDDTVLPYPFTTGDKMLEQCRDNGFSVGTLMMENEKTWRSEKEVREGLLRIWSVMTACIERGCQREGILPGGMKVKRRAAGLYRQLRCEVISDGQSLGAMDWVNLYALAVNEENASGGRVVTAPTNGAAGIIPAVLQYYLKFCNGADDDGIIQFLLTAGAIGILYKENASISGAEVGCQGEVGSACSMAAGALTSVLGGTPAQVENAAEIGMEHNLGLTCDPVGGLVQVPCIERNAMGAVKAINASRLAMRGDGSHFVSLDKVIKTMRDTGRDMKTKYKETSRGGLAVNVIEC